MVGLFVNRHVVEVVGTVRVAQTFHEVGRLGLLSFGLVPRDFLRHRKDSVGRDSTVETRKIKARWLAVGKCPRTNTRYARRFRDASPLTGSTFELAEVSPQ
jgi:hypothetical protein